MASELPQCYLRVASVGLRVKPQRYPRVASELPQRYLRVASAGLRVKPQRYLRVALELPQRYPQVASVNFVLSRSATHGWPRWPFGRMKLALPWHLGR